MKQNYQIDLAGQQAECEANYWRILKLMPEIAPSYIAPDADEFLAEPQRREFAVSATDMPAVRICVEVTERCKYTTMLDICQLNCPAGLASCTPGPRFSLRIYHDAQMAEVVAYNGQRNFRPRYSYPNAAMFQRDEKAQLNSFLGEWLSHCLRYGMALDAAAGTLECE